MTMTEQPKQQPFSGSYAADDVQFLLRPMQMAMTSVAEKERLIQSGQRHYSEMISQEQPPSAEHQALYEQALADGLERLASEVQALAQALQQRRPQQRIVLVSLVRAGVPLGVLLLHALRDLGVEAYHYGVSIIRDKGIDEAALAWLEQRHDFADFVYVDGWVGKGAITQQLEASLGARYDTDIPFVVLADPAGRAWLAASADDWLIPFGILGATVSGLVSRSIWPPSPGWHGCVLYEHLAAHDVSQALVDAVDTKRQQLSHTPTLNWDSNQRATLRQQADQVIQNLSEQYAISNLNRIKPGIAEATRAVMRRVPERILVQDPNDPHLRLLRHLATTRGIELQACGAALQPYRAITLIQQTA